MRNSSILGIACYEAKTLETKIKRAVSDGESLDNSGEMNKEYVEQAHGVAAHMDYRTDRFDLALEAIEKNQASKTARKNATMNVVKDDNQEQKSQLS